MSNPHFLTKVAMRFSMVAAAFVLVICVAAAQEMDRAHGPAIGIYGFKKQSEGGPIPAEYDLVVIHYPAFSTDNSEVLEDISEQAAQGRRVIVDFQFMTTREQRRARRPLPPLDETETALGAMLDQLEGVPLEGITLDEENRTRPERIRYLTELYNRTKQSYPERNFFQWLSLGARQTLRTWSPKTFPADGYVMDPYLVDDQTYGALAELLVGSDKPVYSVVWASPGWEVGAGRRMRAKPEWWNERQWRTFYNRLAVNSEYRINTIFYTYSLPGNLPAALRFGSRCEREFEQALLEVTIAHLRTDPIDPRTPDTRPDWIPAFCQN